MTLEITKRKNGEKKDSNLLSDFFNPEKFFQSMPSFTGSSSLPAVNIRENNNDFIIDVAAPGLKKEDFKIKLIDHTLILSAEKETSSEETGEQYTRKEYSFNSFSRSFALPEEIKEEDIKAKYKEGVLSLTIPKTEEAKKAKPSKEIKIS